MGHPDFRANGRIFATLHGYDRTAWSRSPPTAGRADTGASQDVHPMICAWGRQDAPGDARYANAPAVRAAAPAGRRSSTLPAPRRKRGENNTDCKNRPASRKRNALVGREIRNRPLPANPGQANKSPEKPESNEPGGVVLHPAWPSRVRVRPAPSPGHRPNEKFIAVPAW